MKDVAIIFKRKQMRNGQYKLIPIGFLYGKQDNEKNVFRPQRDILEAAKDLNILKEEYNFVNDIKSIEDEYVFGMPISTKDIKKVLNDDNFEYVQFFLEEYLDCLDNYHYYQQIEENILYSYSVVKKVKETEYINMNEPYETALETYMNLNFQNELKEAETEKNENETKISQEPDENQEEQIQEQETLKNINIKKLYANVTSSVIGQNEQVKQIISAIDVNQKITNPRLKQNILVCGPTGVGKTEIFRLISKNLQIPMVIEDATQYTMAGYVGKSVDDMLTHLLVKSNNDLPLAERGILVVDEIDKKAGGSTEEKVATSGVLESLLKIMEGGIYNLEYQKGKTVEFNTTNLTFVALGAFSYMSKTKPKRQLGFGAQEPDEEKKYSTENFDNFGILPEFIGRCNNKVFMNEMTEDILKQILLTSKNSPLLLCKELFSCYGVDLEYNDEIITDIAKEALNLKTGARSLFEIVFKMTKDARFQVQCERKYKKLILTKETITDSNNYILK